jgi:hypothetical protein
MSLAKLCPICEGCGRTSLDQFGREVPQPTFVSSGTTAQGWSKCSYCEGIGVVAKVQGQRFANGLLIDDYLRTRLGDM